MRAATLALGLLTAAFTPFPAHSQLFTQYNVSNDATGSYVAAWNWSVSKSVTPPSTQYVPPWTPAVFGFEVAVSHSATPQAKQVRVTGNIQVENFGNPAAMLDLSDRLLAPLPATCSVVDAFGAPANGIIVPVFFFDFFTYQCDLPDGPAPASTGLNESTGTFTLLEFPGGQETQSAVVAFEWNSAGESDACVKVENSGVGMTALASPALPDSELCVGEEVSLRYTAAVHAIPGCVEYSSRTRITAVDTLTAGEADAKVRVCGKTGASGPGYWQNKNGRAQISQGAVEADGLTCKAYTFLSGFAPFQDIAGIAPKSCSNVASWAAAVIKASSNRGNTLLSNLRTQMLSTALGVFHNPATLGELDLDLRNVCLDTSACVSPSDPAPNGFGAASRPSAGRAHEGEGPPCLCREPVPAGRRRGVLVRRREGAPGAGEGHVRRHQRGKSVRLAALTLRSVLRYG
jgi:hypothetical protein